MRLRGISVRAVDQNGGQPGPKSRFDIIVGTVANHEDVRSWKIHCVGGRLENFRIWFCKAGLTRNLDDIEKLIDVQATNDGIKAVVEIGNDAEFESEPFEFFQYF